MAKITSSRRRRENRRPPTKKPKVTKSGSGKPNTGSGRVTAGRGGKTPTRANSTGSSRITSSTDRRAQQGKGQKRLSGRPDPKQIKGTTPRANLPSAGQTGGNKPPKGTSAPKDGRKPPNRRGQAVQRARQAAAGSRGTTTRTPTPPKGQGAGYVDDLKKVGRGAKRVVTALARGRTIAQAAGLYIAGQMARSIGKPGAANMSLLGGDAPTRSQKKKGKKK